MSLPPALAMQLAELEAMLESSIPEAKSKLQDVHLALKNSPDVVTILSDEHIGMIVRGLVSISGEALMAVAAKPKKASSKVSAADLGF